MKPDGGETTGEGDGGGARFTDPNFTSFLKKNFYFDLNDSFKFQTLIKLNIKNLLFIDLQWFFLISNIISNQH